MNIRITIYNNKTIHAASYDPVTKEVNLYCDSLKYTSYHADVVDYTEPTKKNISCKKCMKNKEKWMMEIKTKWKVHSLKKTFGYYDTEEEAQAVYDDVKKKNPKLKRLEIQGITGRWMD